MGKNEMSHVRQALYRPRIKSLDLIKKGKVRQNYAIDDQHMLIVATDRLSAFDVVLADPIPGKGVVLTAVSNFWFMRTQDMVANHLSLLHLHDIISDIDERRPLIGRSVIVKRLRPLAVEAIVRGYLIGSGWKEYQQTGAVCGISLPAGLQQAQKLPGPIFTPSTKAIAGDHDENITLASMVGLVGQELTERIKKISLDIYTAAARYALQCGIIIADTKFEFGLDEQDRLILMDEVLTPDSSRFWPVDSYRAGISPPSFDKQYVRDYLETLDWDKTPPAPRLPAQIIQQTEKKYRMAQQRLIGEDEYID